MKTGRAALVFDSYDLTVIAWALQFAGLVDDKDRKLKRPEDIYTRRLKDYERADLKRIHRRVKVAMSRAKA